MIREDGTYEIGQVVDRAWKWFYRYAYKDGKNNCLVTKKIGKGYEDTNDFDQDEKDCEGYETRNWDADDN